MKVKLLIGVAILLAMNINLLAQWPAKTQRGKVDVSVLQVQPISLDRFRHTHTQRSLNGTVRYRTLPGVTLSREKGVNIQVRYRDDEGGIWTEGTIDLYSSSRDLDQSKQRIAMMQRSLLHLGIDQEVAMIEIANMRESEIDHYKYQQYAGDLPVWGNEVTLHLKGNDFQLTGRIRNSPFDHDQGVRLSEQQAGQQAVRVLAGKGVRVFNDQKKQELQLYLADDKKELIWYLHEGVFRRAWHLTVHPNLARRWEFFIDAGNGEVLAEYESLCKVHHLPGEWFDGKSVGHGLDLDGVDQTIQTYEIGGIHTLIDVSRTDMYDPRGAIPGNPIGTIITIDAVKTFPGSDDFNYQDLISNSTTWNNPDAVSAHNNAAIVYEFFRTTFNRISVNGQGGNIISFINVADEDGEDMDNAFWNGKAIFYGKGNQAFTSPLSRALDVAAHELGHGVVQTTANLDYQGESGALNESYADVFGVIVEREDWLIGEDVVNKSIFKDALRNMADPHNGGTSLNDPGYQPAHYQERYTGREDNGGVHINSGIPNRAFYLFAESVGLEVAEQVYYNVLRNYLTRSSQFVDQRIAVIAASGAMFNQQVAQAAAAAFDQVGILGSQGGDYIEDVDVNPGEDFILVTSIDDGLLRIIDPQGNSLTDGPLSQVPPRNPPSITDDGSLVVYVATDQTMRYIEFDWDNGEYNEGILEPNEIWWNVAISKDGTKVAAVLDETSDSVYIFSLEKENFAIYELHNPTTATGDLNTGDVLFADALEWDHTGDYLLYDAFNSLKKFGSQESIEYWDIGFIKVWDESTNDYGDGFITKLFSGLPEGISVGNPTFAKNSPYIIAFDYLEETEDVYAILGVNIETGDIGTIYENTVIGYPSFSRLDDRILFNAEAGGPFTSSEVVGTVGLAADKINARGDAIVFYGDGMWGEWFGNGERELVNVLEGDTESGDLKLYPNPADDVLYLDADWLQRTDDLHMELTGVDGKQHRTYRHSGGSRMLQLDLEFLNPGIYFLKLRGKTIHRVYKVIKN